MSSTFEPSEYKPPVLTVLNERFRKVWVRWFPERERVDLEECGRVFGLKRTHEDACLEGYRHRCKNAKCPTCSTARKVEQVKDVMAMLRGFYDRLGTIPMGVLFLSLTVPKDIGERIKSYADVEAMREIAWSVVCDVFGGPLVPVHGQRARVRVRRFLLAGFPVVQWFHSFKRGLPGNVFKGKNWHVHIPVLNAKYDRLGKVETLVGPVEGCFERLEFGWSRADFEVLSLRLATLWRERMEARFGKSSFVPDGKLGPRGGASHWVEDVEYRWGEAETRRVLDYCFRSVVQDVYREVRFNGYEPSRSDYEFVESMRSLFQGKKAWAASGWMQDSIRNRRFAKVGFGVKRKVERLRDLRRTVCPHGYEFFIDRDCKPLTLDEVVQMKLVVRSGGWSDGRGG